MLKDSVIIGEQIKTVIDGLSILILSNLSQTAYMQYFPVPDPDNMDDVIKIGKQRAKVLRRLREEFENVATGVID